MEGVEPCPPRTERQLLDAIDALNRRPEVPA
jgi:hypothetical protein